VGERTSSRQAARVRIAGLLLLAAGGSLALAAVSGAAEEAGDDATGTDLDLTVGARFDTNEAALRDVLPRSRGFVLHTNLLASHDRRVAGIPWQAGGEVYTDTYTDERDEDYYSVSVWSGPGIEIGGPWSLQPAVGGQLSFSGYERLGLIGDFYLTWDSGGAILLSYAELRLAYEDYRDEFEGYDAPVGSLTLAFGADDPPGWGDAVWLVPSVVYYRAERRAFRYTELAASLAWGGPLAGPVRLDLEAYGSRRFYAGSEEGVGGDRRDWYTLNVVSLSLSPLLSESQTLEARYVYERNWSNESFERYDGHSAGLFLRWRL
jgi:hypothetical protein